MPIVDGGKRIDPAKPNSTTRLMRIDKGVTEHHPYASHFLNLKVSDNGKQFATAVRGRKIPITLENLLIIRKHLGTNVSESVFIAIQLMANAIREGRLNVG